ncbi:MAG TPA: hypothetical protein VM577_05345 [Anaerovoracaceae bacterium]|nr:hypothetical protein [Anaerovoracaceae bacterium]
MSYWNDKSFGKDLKEGDLVFAVYGNIGEGTIYRIEKIDPRDQIKIRSVFCLQDGQFKPARKPRIRTLGAGWIRKVSEEHLKAVLSELDGFLNELRGQKKNDE